MPLGFDHLVFVLDLEGLVDVDYQVLEVYLEWEDAGQVPQMDSLGVLIYEHGFYLLVMFEYIDEFNSVLTAGTADQVIPLLTGVLSLVILIQQQLLLTLNPL